MKHNDLVFTTILLLIAMVPVALWYNDLNSGIQHANMCGGEVRTETIATVAEHLQGAATRSLFIDELSILWQGTTDGRVFAFDLTNEMQEECSVQAAANATINDIIAWRGEVYIGSDGDGVWWYSENGWTKFFPTPGAAEELNDVYALAIDPRNGNILTLTRGGIFDFDGQNWTSFDLMPPDGVLNFHTLATAPVPDEDGKFEWLLGSVSNGTYRYLNGRWERYSSAGLYAWHPGQYWYALPSILLEFPDNVREVEWFPGHADSTFDALTGDPGVPAYAGSTWVIAGDVESGSGLVFLHTGNPEFPQTYSALISQSAGFEYSHLTSVEPLSDGRVVVTNWHPDLGQGGGVHIHAQDLHTQLSDTPSLDVEVAGTNVYIATTLGVFVLRIPSD